MSALDALTQAIGNAPDALLIATYRESDRQMDTIADADWLVVTQVRGAITDELERRHPGTVDRWCDLLDSGDDTDLLDLYEDAANESETR